jgi:hypothetical protein
MKPDAELRMKVYQEGQHAYNAGLACPYTDWRKGTWTKGWQAAKDYNEQLDRLEQPVPRAAPRWTEDQIASACANVGIADSQYESLMIELKETS